MSAQSKSRRESWIDFDSEKETLCLEYAVSKLKKKYAHRIDTECAKRLPSNTGRKWWTQPLDHNDDWLLAQLVIAPKEAIPLHDHPGSAGAHLVLSGDASHYQFTVLGLSQGAWILQQEPLTKKRLSTGDVVSFSSVKGNAHSFVAGREGCTLLNISRRCSKPGYWYYPINDIQSHTVAAIRINR